MTSLSKRAACRFLPLTLVCLAIALLPCLAGCHSDQLPTYPVEGTIRFEDGSFPKFGDIEFYSATHRINARGKINRDGSFKVGTYEPNDGAVEGNHKIIVIQISGTYLTAKYNDEIKHDHGALVNTSYFDYRTSDLECNIERKSNPVELIVRKNPRQTEDGLPKN